MELGSILASGWASGINLYGTVFLLGLANRLDWASTPPALGETWVLVLSGLLYAVEFVVDKIPWLDSLWDAIHTAIRPIGGAIVGAVIARDIGEPEALSALLGGGFSLTAHSAKASTRAAVNLSPEPFTNIGLSVVEDGAVAGMVALAINEPQIAAVVAVVLAVLCIAVVWLLFRTVRRVLVRWRERRRGGPDLAVRRK